MFMASLNERRNHADRFPILPLRNSRTALPVSFAGKRFQAVPSDMKTESPEDEGGAVCVEPFLSLSMALYKALKLSPCKLACEIGPDKQWKGSELPPDTQEIS